MASRATYRQVVGSEPGHLAAARSIEHLLPNSVGDLIDIALLENPAIHAASYGIRAAELQKQIVRGELLPTVSVSAMLAKRQDVLSRGDEQSTASIVGRFSIPLYEGGEIAARTSQAGHLATQRTLEMDAVRDQVRNAASTSWARCRTAQQRASNARVQLKAAGSALSGIRDQWNLGDRTMREVLDAEQELLAAEINLIIAERDRIVSSYAMAKVAGKLTLSALAETVLTAPHDSVFDIRSVVISAKPVERRVKQACGKNCAPFANGWTLRKEPQ